MVDDEIATAIPALRDLSEQIKTVKDTVFGNFDTILKMKAEVLGLTKDDQRSHTFTTSDSRLRLTLGVNTIDGYRDTVEDGIAMVKAYIESLAKDRYEQSPCECRPAPAEPRPSREHQGKPRVAAPPHGGGGRRREVHRGGTHNRGKLPAH